MFLGVSAIVIALASAHGADDEYLSLLQTHAKIVDNASSTTACYQTLTRQYCEGLHGDYTTGSSSLSACQSRCTELGSLCVAVTYYDNADDPKCYVEDTSCTPDWSSSGNVYAPCLSRCPDGKPCDKGGCAIGYYAKGPAGKRKCKACPTGCTTCGSEGTPDSCKSCYDGYDFRLITNGKGECEKKCSDVDGDCPAGFECVGDVCKQACSNGRWFGRRRTRHWWEGYTPEQYCPSGFVPEAANGYESEPGCCQACPPDQRSTYASGYLLDQNTGCYAAGDAPIPASDWWAMHFPSKYCGKKTGWIDLGPNTLDACKSAADANDQCGKYLMSNDGNYCSCYETCTSPRHSSQGSNIYIRTTPDTTTTTTNPKCKKCSSKKKKKQKKLCKKKQCSACPECS